MADSLFFSRDTRVFIRLGTSDNAWEIPVLDGFSFSQATNASEVTLNEMADSDGASRRGRQTFNDSYAPAEWSFSTYARPFFDTTLNKDQAVEQVLWALLAGHDPHYASGEFASISSGGTAIISHANNKSTVDFQTSNNVTLGTADIWFMMGDSSDDATNTTELTAYKLEGCVVNEASFDFDLDGIATINWSGFGKIIKEVNVSASSAAAGQTSVQKNDDLWLDVSESAYTASSVAIAKSATIAAGNAALIYPSVNGIDKDTNYIRNRLSYLSASSSLTGSIGLALTGGNITINNNINFVTPETLGVVNQPLGHVTGTRTVTGSATCYLNNEDNSSADLFSDIVGDTSNIQNSFELTFSIGGGIGDGNSNSILTPAIEFKMDNCHLELPTHSIEDVITLETSFHALPSTIAGTDEIKISFAD